MKPHCLNFKTDYFSGKGETMYILAIDQGTTGTTTILYNKKGQLVDKAYRPFTQIYPKPGWVEHDPLEIWQTVTESVTELTSRNKGEISALGITNQRETTILWDGRTGKPVHNAIVWQCRRTAAQCDALQGHSALFRQKTGLPIDAYFSGTKIKWLLDNVADLDLEHLKFGTIDTWLIWKLTGGRVHATDYTNASRTLIYNIKEKKWDSELCEIIGVPKSILPQVKKSADDYGTVSTIPELAGVPIGGVVGDQQAALFGQRCFEAGQLKNTYGTGCFLLVNTGDRWIESKHGLLTTLAVNGQGEPCYALEGAVFIAGAAIQWLRDELGLLNDSADSEAAAMAVPDNAGVYLVPAFVGLGAPHWDMQARGTITGLTRGANKNHLIRAALEAMAYQTRDVVQTMQQETGKAISEIDVDGGAAANNFLMQFQSDILDVPLVRPEMVETTALGAAYLAGLQSGFWKDSAAILALERPEQRFAPKMQPAERNRLISGWQKALRQTTAE